MTYKPSIYVYGASHSLGYNQKDWDIKKGFSPSAYPWILAEKLNYNVVNRAKTGAGVDYTHKLIVSEPNIISDNDIGILQINPNYSWKTIYDEVNKRIYSGAVQYHSLDHAPTGHIIDYDFVELLDFMNYVNSSIFTLKILFKRTFIFLDNHIRDYKKNKEKLPLYSNHEVNIFNKFEYNLTYHIRNRILVPFGTSIENGSCEGDSGHFERKVHDLWTDIIIKALQYD